MIISTTRKLKSLFFAESLLGRFNKGAFWIMVSTLGLQGSNLLITIFLARFFGQKGYGEISMTISTFALLGEIAGAGFGLTTTKYIAEFKNKDPQRAGRIIGLSLAFSLILGTIFSILLLLWPQLVTTTLIKSPELATLFRIGALQALFTAVIGVVLGIFAGLEAFDKVGLTNFIRGILYVFAAIAGSFLLGINGAVLATTVSAGIGLLLGFVFLKKQLSKLNISIRFKGALQEIPITYKFALPALLSNLGVIGAVWITNLILVNKPSGFAELGQLNVANQWKNLLMLMPNIIAQVLLPLLSSELGDSNTSSSGKILGLFQSITMLVIFPISIFFIFYADIILFIYGGEFQNSRNVLVGSVWTVIVASAGSVLGAFVQSSGKMWIGFTTNTAYGLLLILLTYLYASSYGASAVAFGNGVSYVFITFLNLYLLRKHISGQLGKQILLAVGLSSLVLILYFIIDAAVRPYLGVIVLLVVEFLVFRFIISPDVREKVKNLLSRFLLKKDGV